VTQPTWFVLLHTPGPAIEPGQSVAEHPGMQQHYAFLRRMLEAGRLVAAGPFGDAAGEGMTVLAAESADEVDRLAREDDQAVAGGVLVVRIRPWRVVMRGDPAGITGADHAS
jgi:uncharacterized protein YciI